jgi:hypothetical protein
MKKRIALTGALLLFGGVMILKNKKPRGIRNNNPLNIRENGTKWNGRAGDDGAFVQFSSPAFGIRAAARILKNYRDKYNLDTVTGIINRWAPPVENDTQSYIDSVAKKTDVSPNQTLADSDYENLIRAMIYHENGEQPYTVDIIKQGFNEGFYT